MALLLPPPRGRDRRRPPLHVPGQRQRRAPDLRVRPARLDPHVDVDPARPGRLRPAGEADRLERLAADHGHVAHLRPRARPGTGSRSTRSSSGWSRSSARTGCGLRSRQPRLATHASPAASSTTISSAVRPDGNVSVATRIQSGPVVGRALLEERLLLGAVHEALERHRAPAHPHQRAVGHGEEVADQVQLRVPGAREVDLVRVADRDLAAADLEDLLPGRHALILGGRASRGAAAPLRRGAAGCSRRFRRRPFVATMTARSRPRPHGRRRQTDALPAADLRRSRPATPPPRAWAAMLQRVRRLRRVAPTRRGWIPRRRGARRTSTTATTVSVRDGRRIVTDGPFAETKEHLGGYYLIDAPGPRRRDRGRVPGPRREDRQGRDPPDPGDRLIGARRRRRTRRLGAASPGSSARSTGGRSRR